ncbi:MAG TPA: hypothetical protein VGB92_17695 [Longimicrobium sp.]|jgi:hypothetical protein
MPRSVHLQTALRIGPIATALLALSACASAGGLRRGEGPFQPASSVTGYPGSGGAYPAPAAQAVAAGPPLPAGLVNEGGLKPLPGARYAGVGPLGALVIPVSLGNRVPTYDERTVAARLFGEGSDEAGTVRDLLTRESGGAMRFTTRTLPLLVAPQWRAPAGQPRELERLASMALESWARQLDLSVYDNDGPDGIPTSRDDDGQIDLVILTVESDTPFASRIVHPELELRSSGRRLRAGHVLAVHVPRGAQLDVMGTTRLILHTLGLGESECFFPEGYGRTLSSLARARLGWLAASPVPRAGTYRLPEAHGVIIPLADVPAGTGFWLLERQAERIYASRVARQADGRFFATRLEKLEVGAEQILPLTRQLGVRGPRVRLYSDEGGEARIEVVLETRSGPGSVSPLQPIDEVATVPTAPVRSVAAPRVDNTPLDP